MSGDLLVNLLAAAIWVCLGVLAAHLMRLISRRRKDALVQFTEFRAGSGPIHIVYGLIEHQEPNSSYTIEEGDVAALCAALSLVQSRYGFDKTSPINAYAARSSFSSYEQLLLVSGPLWNGIAKYYLEKCLAPVEFCQVNDPTLGASDDVLRSSSSMVQYSTKREDGLPRECYGLVLSGRFPPLQKGPPQLVTIAAGISPLGTFGAVHWLRTLSGRKLEHAIGHPHSSQASWRYAVVRAHDRSPKGFRSYAAELDKPAFLDLEVVEYLEG